MGRLIRGKRTGFTLFELLVVLILISLIMSFVGPRLFKSLNRRNIESTARQIAASLRYARSGAVSEKLPYRALFDMDANRLTIERYAPPAEDASEPEAESHEKTKVFTLTSGIRFNKGISFGGETVENGIFEMIFYPAGGTSGGEIFLMDEEKRTFRIVVDMITGSVTINQGDSADV
jgi:general secretion pathway protein H